MRDESHKDISNAIYDLVTGRNTIVFKQGIG